jgi:hypothetical protein
VLLFVGATNAAAMEFTIERLMALIKIATGKIMNTSCN